MHIMSAFQLRHQLKIVLLLWKLLSNTPLSVKETNLNKSAI